MSVFIGSRDWVQGPVMISAILMGSVTYLREPCVDHDSALTQSQSALIIMMILR